jgi:hypothetical protein
LDGAAPHIECHLWADERGVFSGVGGLGTHLDLPRQEVEVAFYT